MIKFTILWTDALIFLLVFALCLLTVLLKNNVETRKNWRKVFRSRIGLSTAVIMVFYILVALLDSIHFRLAHENAVDSDIQPAQVHYSNEVISVLDLVLDDLKNSAEKTYSAPFSLYSFAKENVTDEQGRVYRDFPRLIKAGQHIEQDADKWPDIVFKSITAIGKGLMLSVIVCFLFTVLLRIVFGDLGVGFCWTTLYATTTLIVVLCTWMLELSGWYHVLGTDRVGTDVLYQGIKSIRTGVLIGTLSTLLALPFAISFGISAGYFKGWIDDVIQYIYTTLSSIPDILLIAAAVIVIDVYIETNVDDFGLLIYRADFKFLALCLIFGLTSWTGLCRLLRAETLKVSQLDYVEAARAFGVSHSRIIFRHILPNVMHLVIISLVLSFSGFVLAEAVLAYIGVGVDASMNSWGNMINSARSELSRDPTVWWSIIAAFIFMFVLVLSANLFSDRVRDAFDPRMAALEGEGGSL